MAEDVTKWTDIKLANELDSWASAREWAQQKKPIKVDGLDTLILREAARRIRSIDERLGLALREGEEGPRC